MFEDCMYTCEIRISIKKWVTTGQPAKRHLNGILLVALATRDCMLAGKRVGLWLASDVRTTGFITRHIGVFVFGPSYYVAWLLKYSK